MYKGKVYFDKTTHNPHYRSDYTWEWYPEQLEERNLYSRDNFIFKDRLRLVRVWNHMYLKSMNNGREYIVFRSDIEKFIPQMVNGEIESFFTFRNSGGRIGLVLVAFDYEDYTPPQNNTPSFTVLHPTYGPYTVLTS